ncbi:MAG: 2,3-bisphosphoglycerate-independent phosphoglycerate mutase, partial [Flavobacteriia bacterium]|nr:2,3-bisphosphoglycerate-independent phosphoglycerate mutase [Flavobacteriia bacterium]
ETIDEQLRIIVEFLLQKDYIMLILADHGNAELAFNKDGSPNTAHTLNPVPCVLVGCTQDRPLRNGILADVAPTILSLMGVDLPIEMTGCSLLLVER